MTCSANVTVERSTKSLLIQTEMNAREPHVMLGIKWITLMDTKIVSRRRAKWDLTWFFKNIEVKMLFQKKHFVKCTKEDKGSWVIAGLIKSEQTKQKLGSSAGRTLETFENLYIYNDENYGKL